jgi:hypothetical protein
LKHLILPDQIAQRFKIEEEQAKPKRRKLVFTKEKSPIDLSVLDVFRETVRIKSSTWRGRLWRPKVANAQFLLAQNSHNANACKEYIESNVLTSSGTICCQYFQERGSGMGM